MRTFSFADTSLEELYSHVYGIGEANRFAGFSLREIEDSLMPKQWRTNSKKYPCLKRLASKNYMNYLIVASAIHRCKQRHMSTSRGSDPLNAACEEIKEYCTARGIGEAGKMLNRLKQHLLELQRKRQLKAWGAFSLANFKMIDDLKPGDVEKMKKENPTLADFTAQLQRVEHRCGERMLRSFLRVLDPELPGVAKMFKKELIGRLFDALDGGAD